MPLRLSISKRLTLMDIDARKVPSGILENELRLTNESCIEKLNKRSSTADREVFWVDYSLARLSLA